MDVSTPKRTLRLFIVMQESIQRCHFEKLLNDCRASGELDTWLPNFATELESITAESEAEFQQRAFSRLKEHFSQGPHVAAVLLSDMLTGRLGDTPKAWAPTSFAKECQDHFQRQLYATIAVMPAPHKVLDIDRAIGRHPDAKELHRVLELAGGRLSYLVKPERKLPRRVDVRIIATRQSELKKYFELRHQIYRPMGYLSRAVEDCASKMDMDWCDKKAIHCGAFVRMDDREHLVGTARVVTSAPVTAENEYLFHELAGKDLALRRELARPLQLGLPIFESQPTSNRLLSEILDNDEPCGELSRVTVAPAFRGGGISERLIEFAIAQARRCELRRMFLECLDIHERLYAKKGFVRVPEMRGKVVGVDRTMIVMQLPPALLAPQAEKLVSR